MESILRIWIDYETQTGASSTEHPLEHITVTMCMSYAYLIVQTRKLKAQERKSQNPGSSFRLCSQVMLCKKARGNYISDEMLLPALIPSVFAKPLRLE